MVAQLMMSHSNQMDNLVRGWLVFQLTGSISQLALVAATKSIPLLAIGVVGGILADKFDRRVLLQCSAVSMAVIQALTAGVIFLGMLEVWHLYASAAAIGLTRAIQAPTRYSILPLTVDRSCLQNAVVYNNAAGNVAQSLGPALGGVIIAVLGFGWAFTGQAVLLVGAAFATEGIRVYGQGRPERKKESFYQSLRGGLEYARTNRVVLSLLMLALLPMLFAMPFQNLIPAIADELLSLGPAAAGLLLGAAGAGSIFSLVVLALFPMTSRQGVSMLVAVIGFGGAITVFAATSTFAVALGAVWLTGMFRGVYRTFNHTLLSAHTDDEYRGRINSFYTLDRGIMPLGTAILGFASEFFGIRLALGTSGMICVLLGFVAVSIAKPLRNL